MDQVELQKLVKLSAKVAELERKVNFLLEKLNLDYIDVPPPAEYPEVEEWLRNGQKLMAIKAYQMSTGAGLKEAKSAAEAIQKKM